MLVRILVLILESFILTVVWNLIACLPLGLPQITFSVCLSISIVSIVVNRVLKFLYRSLNILIVFYILSRHKR